MGWEINFTAVFGDWWNGLPVEEQVVVERRVVLLAEGGPNLGRPTVDTITSSRHANMKELRVGAGGSIRVLFVFDPRRQAILLLGGSKAGAWNEWYRLHVPVADDLFDAYLQDLRDEGLI